MGELQGFLPVGAKKKDSLDESIFLGAGRVFGKTEMSGGNWACGGGSAGKLGQRAGNAGKFEMAGKGKLVGRLIRCERNIVVVLDSMDLPQHERVRSHGGAAARTHQAFAARQRLVVTRWFRGVGS